MLSRSHSIVALGAIAIYGLSAGILSGRWTPAARDNSAANLENVPVTIQGWHGQALQLGTKELQAAEIKSHLYRTYTHETTGQTVSVILVHGRSGPISVHQPTVCYQGAGYEL